MALPVWHAVAGRRNDWGSLTRLKKYYIYLPLKLFFEGASNASVDATGAYGPQEAFDATFRALSISQIDGLSANARQVAEEALLAAFADRE